MTNNDMLQNIEYLREKASVSYEEAAQLLEQFDGSVMRAVVELEKRGRLYSQGASDYVQPGIADQWQRDVNEAKGKAASFIQKANKTHVIIEKKLDNGETDTIANVSALIAAGITIFAPYVTLAAIAFGYASGYHVKVKRADI